MAMKILYLDSLKNGNRPVMKKDLNLFQVSLDCLFPSIRSITLIQPMQILV